LFEHQLAKDVFYILKNVSICLNNGLRPFKSIFLEPILSQIGKIPFLTCN
jgi:hypothetical protein